MNILMVHPHDLFDSSEPWTIRIKSIAEEFVKNGHTVQLCYFPFKNGQRPSFELLNGLQLYALDRTLSPGALLRNISKLKRLAKWADMVHFQKCHHYSSIPSVIAAFANGKPLHYDWDDWEEKIFFESCRITYKTFFIGYTFKVLERFLPLLADTVSVASQHLKKLAMRFGKKPAEIFMTPVGVDLHKFRPDLDGECVRQKYGIDGPLVLYIGQLHGAQYVDLLIHAANIVLHENPQVRFMIVGEGFLKENLKGLVSNLGLEEKIIFTGAVPHDQVPFYIASADVCVAVFEETDVTKCKSPLKIVEYLAGGKPIVASNVGEVSAMLAGVGMLTKAGDFNSLAKGINTFLADKNLREKMGRLARKRAETKYRWANTAQNLLNAYKKAMGPDT
ncbi:MAG: glycosyltransferase family 4 protein [Candidatus Omnitrophica bacterium]|nr:glycosyltransferase family 4 protein [Candidatus Omnitrophota bacterium]